MSYSRPAWNALDIQRKNTDALVNVANTLNWVDVTGEYLDIVCPRRATLIAIYQALIAVTPNNPLHVRFDIDGAQTQPSASQPSTSTNEQLCSYAIGYRQVSEGTRRVKVQCYTGFAIATGFSERRLTVFQVLRQ